MAIYVNTLNAGNVTLGSSGSSEHQKTKVKYITSSGLNDWEGDITGEIAGTYRQNPSYPTTQIPNVNLAEEIYIGTNVTAIGSDAFYECTNIKKIIIPNSVTSINDGSSFRKTGLTSITIPDSVTSSIPDCAFYWCTELTNITIGNGVTGIGSDAFEKCEKLTNIVLPNSMTSIGTKAFFRCSNLTNITLGTGLTTIGNQALGNCSSLTSITIPESVTNIGVNAFSYSGLTSVTFLGKTMEQVQNIKDNQGVNRYPWGISDTSIINVA